MIQKSVERFFANSFSLHIMLQNLCCSYFKLILKDTRNRMSKLSFPIIFVRWFSVVVTCAKGNKFSLFTCKEHEIRWFCEANGISTNQNANVYSLVIDAFVLLSKHLKVPDQQYNYHILQDLLITKTYKFFQDNLNATQSVVAV